MLRFHRPGPCARRALAEMGPDAMILDHRIGDVTGEGCPQDVYLAGVKPGGPGGIYCAGITLVIASRCADLCITAPLELSGGYDPRLALQDLTGDGIEDLLIHILGRDGGPGCHFVYSCAGYSLDLRFDHRHFNRVSRYGAAWWDDHTVGIRSEATGRTWTLSVTGPLSESSRRSGKTAHGAPLRIEPLSVLIPLPGSGENPGGLLAIQPIVAGEGALGAIETRLSWENGQFVPRSVSVSP